MTGDTLSDLDVELVLGADGLDHRPDLQSLSVALRGLPVALRPPYVEPSADLAAFLDDRGVVPCPPTRRAVRGLAALGSAGLGLKVVLGAAAAAASLAVAGAAGVLPPPVHDLLDHLVPGSSTETPATPREAPEGVPGPARTPDHQARGIPGLRDGVGREQGRTTEGVRRDRSEGNPGGADDQEASDAQGPAAPPEGEGPDSGAGEDGHGHAVADPGEGGGEGRHAEEEATDPPQGGSDPEELGPAHDEADEDSASEDADGEDGEVDDEGGEVDEADDDGDGEDGEEGEADDEAAARGPVASEGESGPTLTA